MTIMNVCEFWFNATFVLHRTSLNIVSVTTLCSLIIKIFQGCTATMLLVWADGQENFYAQCANVGDSACVVKYVFHIIFINSITSICIRVPWLH